MIAAQRLLGHVVAGGFICPGAASAAHLAELADPALALEIVEVTEVLEYFRIVPDQYHPTQSF